MRAKARYVAAVAVAAAGLVFGASGAAHADGDPYPARSMQNLVTGLCIDSNYSFGQVGTTPAYVTECNGSHINQGWYSQPAGGGIDEVQIYNEWSGCLQAVPSTNSVVVAPCDNDTEQMWTLYPQAGTQGFAAIWSYNTSACGFDCYLADDQGLVLSANNGLHPPGYELWSAPQSGA